MQFTEIRIIVCKIIDIYIIFLYNMYKKSRKHIFVIEYPYNIADAFIKGIERWNLHENNYYNRSSVWLRRT